MAEAHVHGSRSGVRRITVRSVVAWLFGVSFLIAGVQYLLTGAVAVAVFMFAAGAVATPYTRERIESATGYAMSGPLAASVVIVLWVVALLLLL